MDLLSQYKQQNPKAFQEKKPLRLSDEYGRTYTGMVAFVMRLSGGRIRDVRQASYVLLGAAALIVLISLGVFFFGGGSRMAPPPGHITKEAGPPRLEIPATPR